MGEIASSRTQAEGTVSLFVCPCYPSEGLLGADWGHVDLGMYALFSLIKVLWFIFHLLCLFALISLKRTAAFGRTLSQNHM